MTILITILIGMHVISLGKIRSAFSRIEWRNYIGKQFSCVLQHSNQVAPNYRVLQVFRATQHLQTTHPNNRRLSTKRKGANRCCWQLLKLVQVLHRSSNNQTRVPKTASQLPNHDQNPTPYCEQTTPMNDIPWRNMQVLFRGIQMIKNISCIHNGRYYPSPQNPGLSRRTDDMSEKDQKH